LTERIVLRDGEMARIYRFELLNNVVNIVATLFISIGLFGFEFFREFVDPSRLVGPITLGALAYLLAYFTSRFFVLTRYFKTTLVPLHTQEVSS
jgi:hypothetical protein